MKREKLLVSTVAGDATETAVAFGFGLEIAEYCTAYNLDVHRAKTDAQVLSEIKTVSAAGGTGRAVRPGAEARGEGAEKNAAGEGKKQVAARVVAPAGWVFHAPFNELFPCAIDPEAAALARRRYEEAAACALSYGISGMVVHAGYLKHVYYKEWFIEQSAAFWRDFLRDKPASFRLYAENVFEDDPALLPALADAVGDARFRLCLDIGHANCVSQAGVLAFLEQAGGRIGHFHLHDNPGDGDRHGSLGEGNIPLAALLTRAAALCPDASYTLEALTARPSAEWLCKNGFLEE